MKKPYLIGIAGGTCSGKTTLTDRLKEKFEADGKKVVVFNMDRYFKKPSPTTIAPITRKEYVEHNHPDTVKLDELDRDYFAAVEAGEADLIMLEGLFPLYLDNLRESFDLKVFVDLASDARLARRIPKFMGFGHSFDEVVERYIDTVRFRHNELIEPTRWHADIVVNGTLDDNKATDVLYTYINTQL